MRATTNCILLGGDATVRRFTCKMKMVELSLRVSWKDVFVKEDYDN